MHAEAWRAIRNLQQREELVLAAQNVVELWVVATRPVELNGLGMTPARAAKYLTRVVNPLPMLVESPEIHKEWRRLVIQYGVSGKKAHDTRLVAAMLVQGIQTIVTFNGSDFVRYAGIRVLHPHEIVA